MLLQDNHLTTEAKAQCARENLTADTGEDAIHTADILIESAPEEMGFKQDLFEHLDAVAKPEAVLASNTSGLSINGIASKCKRRERVLTTHFWNPPHLMPLVELVSGSKTDPAVVESVAVLLEACGKTTVSVRKDTPGQLGNRLQMALLREAIHIVEDGIASVEDVDLAAKNGFGLRLPVYGIFEHQDAVGLDLGMKVAEYVMQDLYSQPHPPEYARNLLREGHLGAKTGKGYYDWSGRSMDAVKARRDEFLLSFLQSKTAQGITE